VSIWSKYPVIAELRLPVTDHLEDPGADACRARRRRVGNIPRGAREPGAKGLPSHRELDRGLAREGRVAARRVDSPQRTKLIAGALGVRAVAPDVFNADLSVEHRSRCTGFKSLFSSLSAVTATLSAPAAD
jgi:hypothetical protein